MSKEIIVNAELAEEIRIAIVENNRLMDLDIETQSRTKHKGNIYKGIVSNIEDSLEAAFVDIGEEKQAFLPKTEIRPQLYPEGLNNPKKAKVSEILSRGQEIIVQVTKDEIGTKGAAVSTYLSLPGRYVVLMHSDESGGGISRKIENEYARKAARDMLSRLSVPEGIAVIIRTAGVNATRQDLLRDFRTLCDIWQQIDKSSQLGRAPTLIYREPDIVVRTIRDYFSSDVSKIVIDNEEEYEEALGYFHTHMPDLEKLLERHRKKDSIFQYYGIEQAIEELFHRQVKLPSGGYIIIEQTEALVSVDVNSGKSTSEEDHEATVYKTNLEAAEELARQLRLRDLGGIVVVDFIDMVSKRHRRDVERHLENAMASDKAKVKVRSITENGTLELTRQRLRQSHHLISHVPCKTCEGTGRVRDAQGLAIAAIRRINSYLSKKRPLLAKLIIRLPVDAANFLNNQKRRELLSLADSHELDIEVIGDSSLSMTDMEFKEEKRGQAGLEAASQMRDHSWQDKKSSSKYNKNNNDKWNTVPRITVPPTIGPVPTIIEEDLLQTEEMPLEELPLVSTPPLSPKEGVTEPYDDPLMEAFFGQAPSIELPPLQKVSPEVPVSPFPPEKSPAQEIKNGDNIGNQIPLSEDAIDDNIGNQINAPSAKRNNRRFSRNKKRFQKKPRTESPNFKEETPFHATQQEG